MRLPQSPAELQIRIACSGRNDAQALLDLRRGLAVAESVGCEPLVVLEELGRLQDSVVTFMKGLSRMLVDYPGTVTFWESSGYTEAFLSVVERPVPAHEVGQILEGG